MNNTDGDEFFGGLWWVPGEKGRLRSANHGEAAREIQRLRAELSEIRTAWVWAQTEMSDACGALRTEVNALKDQLNVCQNEGVTLQICSAKAARRDALKEAYDVMKSRQRSATLLRDSISDESIIEFRNAQVMAFETGALTIQALAVREG